MGWLYGRRRRRGSGGVIVLDTFTRTDSNLTLGTSETGHVWTAHNSSVWGIASNQAKYVSDGSDNQLQATVDAGVSNCLVTATLAVAVDGAALLARYVDLNNHWQLRAGGANYALFRVEAGFNSEWSGGTAPANGDVLALRLNGSSITVYLNGEAMTTVTSSAHSSATLYGIAVDNTTDTACRWDTFSVVS